MTVARRRLAIIVMAVSFVAACGGSDDATPDSLPGTDWTLVDASLDVTVPEQVNVTMSFSDDVVSGNAGCNQYTGEYTVDDGALTMGPLATTRKACVPDVAAVEVSVLERIAAATAVEQDADELRLLDDNGSVLLRFSSAS